MDPEVLTERLAQLVDFHFNSGSQELEVISVYTEEPINLFVKVALQEIPNKVEHSWNSLSGATEHFLALEDLFSQGKIVVLHMTQEQLLQEGTNLLNWKKRYSLQLQKKKLRITPGILLLSHVSDIKTYPLQLLQSISSGLLNWNVELRR